VLEEVTNARAAPPNPDHADSSITPRLQAVPGGAAQLSGRSDRRDLGSTLYKGNKPMETFTVARRQAAADGEVLIAR